MSNCDAISWLAAWAMWWADQTVGDCRLYGGWTVRTWGRIGKVLQFLATATLVAELIGYERLARFCQGPERAFRITAFSRSKDNVENVFIILVVSLMVSTLIIMGSGRDKEEIQAIFFVILFFSFTIAILFMLIPTAFSLYLFVVFWVFAHPNARKILGSLTLFVIVAGFTLDLLAS